MLYITGKYTDPRGTYFVTVHIEEARRITGILWTFGIPTLCPHTNTYLIDGLCPYDDFISCALQLMSRCDAVVALPNYLTSDRSLTEIAHARDLGKQVFYWPDELSEIVNYAMPDGIASERMRMARYLMTEEESAKADKCCIQRLSSASVQLGQTPGAVGRQLL